MADGLDSVPTNRSFGEGRSGVDSANSSEGLIDWNSMAPSSSRERLQSGANAAFSPGEPLGRVASSGSLATGQPGRRRPAKQSAPGPKLANRTPLALVIDSFLVRTANYAVGDRDGSH